MVNCTVSFILKKRLGITGREKTQGRRRDIKMNVAVCSMEVRDKLNCCMLDQGTAWRLWATVNAVINRALTKVKHMKMYQASPSSTKFFLLSSTEKNCRIRKVLPFFIEKGFRLASKIVKTHKKRCILWLTKCVCKTEEDCEHFLKHTPLCGEPVEVSLHRSMNPKNGVIFVFHMLNVNKKETL